MLATRVLSFTLLKGEPVGYTMELPPFRKPQTIKIIIRSIFDRTIFVLGRALTVAVPASLVIFGLSNITVDGVTLLKIISDFLDPVGRIMGLDGIILIGFILGFPANEIVVPIILMGYLSQNSLSQLPDITVMQEILLSNGWTVKTAICLLVFSLFHWPCSTTLMTVKKETGSVKWTLVAALLPTAVGILMCMLFANLARLFSSLLYI
jgi:ferrous iron transport protein B